MDSFSVQKGRDSEVTVVGSAMQDLVVYCDSLPMMGQTISGIPVNLQSFSGALMAACDAQDLHSVKILGAKARIRQ